MAKGDFLDSTKAHTLSERECDLIALFRNLSNTKQEVLIKTLFMMVREQEEKKAERRLRRKEKQEQS